MSLNVAQVMYLITIDLMISFTFHTLFLHVVSVHYRTKNLWTPKNTLMFLKHPISDLVPHLLL